MHAVPGPVLGPAQHPRRQPPDVHGQQLAAHLGLAAEERHVLVVGVERIGELHQPGDRLEHASGGVTRGLGEMRPREALADHHGLGFLANTRPNATAGQRSLTVAATEAPAGRDRRATDASRLRRPSSPPRLAARERDPPEFDPYLNDPDGWGVSMAQMTEMMLPCLDAAGVSSIAEVGAFAGDLTRVLRRVGGRRRRPRGGDRPGAPAGARAAGRRAPGARADPPDQPRGAARRSRCPTRS